MLTKLKLCFPLLLILAMITVALPVKSVAARGTASPAVPQTLSPCSVRKLVDIDGEFSTVFSIVPYNATASRVNIFGFGSLFINHRHVGGIVLGSQIVNAGVVPNTLDGTFSFLTTDGSLIFFEVTGTAASPDAAGNVSFSADLLFFGGTRTHLGAKGDGMSMGTANLMTSKGTFTFEGHIRTNVSAPCPG